MTRRTQAVTMVAARIASTVMGSASHATHRSYGRVLLPRLRYRRKARVVIFDDLHLS